MDQITSQPRAADVPARHLRLLANLGPLASVVLGALTVWLVVSTLQNLAQPMSSAVVVSLVLGTLGAVLAGLATLRLAVDVPRVLRGWQVALAERTQVLRDR